VSGKSRIEVSKDDLLAPLIRNVPKELFLTLPLFGSPYRGLFLANKSEGYLGEPGEPEED